MWHFWALSSVYPYRRNYWRKTCFFLKIFQRLIVFFTTKLYFFRNCWRLAQLVSGTILQVTSRLAGPWTSHSAYNPYNQGSFAPYRIICRKTLDFGRIFLRRIFRGANFPRIVAQPFIWVHSSLGSFPWVSL